MTILTPFTHAVERGSYQGYRCSNCHTPFLYARPLFSTVTSKQGAIFHETPSFCPCCGAKREEEKEAHDYP